MKTWWISNLWWLLHIFGLTTILANNVLGRKFGLCWGTYLFTVAMAMFINSWAFILAYSLAPSFHQMWFVSMGILALYGFAGSIVFFGETITLIKLIGVGLTLLGAFLLIK